MKRIMLNLLGALTVCVALNLQLSTTLAQGTASTVLTITNPAPAVGDNFGYSVVAVGSDRMLIGAFGDDMGVGASYLFGTNGALLVTFTNPSPAASDLFGFSVAAVGTDRVLVGAPYDDIGEADSGAVYLFSTTGALLTTFTNPPPATDDWFGLSVAAVGT